MLIFRRILNSYRDAFSGLPGELWLLAFVALVNRAGTMVLPFMTLYLTVERGLTVAEAGQIVGLYGMGSVAGSYLGGWLSDRLGAIRAQQFSLALGGISFLVLGTVRGRVALAVATLLASIVVEAFRPAVMASFGERAPAPLRARSFALLRLASNLGFGIGPAAGGWLALYSYRWLFVADALTCWMAAGLLVLVPAARRPQATVARSESTPERPPWRDGSFLLLLLSVVALASALFQIFSTFPLHLREHIGLRENAIGLLFSLNAFLIVLFEMVLIHSVRNRDSFELAGFGSLLLCTGIALTALGSTVWWVALTVVVWTFGEMLALPMLNVLVAERASGGGYQGQYMGLYTMAYSVAFIIAPVVGTAVYQRFGPSTLWLGIGGLGVVLWFSFTGLRRLRRPGSSQPSPRWSR